MKFARPRKLQANTYSDLNTPQPELFHELCNKIIYPPENSDRERYMMRSIEDLKARAKTKNKTVKLNQLLINRKLYFMNICICTKEMDSTDTNIQALVDTEAANSLIHTKTASRLGIKYEACKMTICTATGTDTESVKGIAHTKILMRTTKYKIESICVNFIVIDKLNGMDCIIGADFLKDDKNVAGVSNMNLIYKDERGSHRVKISDQNQLHTLDKVNIYTKNDKKEAKESKRTCLECRKRTVTNIHSMWVKQNGEGEVEVVGVDKKISKDTYRKHQFPPDIPINSHSIKEENNEETLPESSLFFEDSQELKEEILKKKITLADGDCSECPPEHKPKLMALLEDFKDRFSESKLDLEITDMYTADLETTPGRIVNQKCRRLPTDRFEFAQKAIKQLQDMGVVSESDSEWRSNVVMVPKPQTRELRANSKLDMLDKSKKTELYRICLDFRNKYSS
jgi:hypothetical protein